jgi:predicted O-methyltransferase YrrM
MADKPHFFISRVGEDAEYAKWVAEVLEEAGYTTILQDLDFQAGDSFIHKMNEALAAAEQMIAQGRIAVTDDVAEVEAYRAGSLLPPPPQRRQRNVEAFRRLLFCEIQGPLVHGSLQTTGFPLPSRRIGGCEAMY